MNGDPQVWTVKALTPIWTGDATGANGRLITTGLLGSIRWWFEVLVRGFGGSACDPSDPSGRCPDERRRCVVCELFGCTGWARKFRFQVLDKDDGTQSSAIQKDTAFKLRLIPVRPLQPEQWALINLTLRLIAEYGALGGKTIYKPSDEQNRQNMPHHRDYGLVEITQTPTVTGRDLRQLKAHVCESGWRSVNHGDSAWASLEVFWCVNGRYLARQNGNTSTFNRVIGRPEPKDQAGGNDSWLAGRRPRDNVGPESKKIFSFKSPARTFGFMKPGTSTLHDVKQSLRAIWPGLKDEEFVVGNKILESLLCKANET